MNKEQDKKTTKTGLKNTDKKSLENLKNQEIDGENVKGGIGVKFDIRMPQTTA